MDLQKIIRELMEERDRVDNLIQSLEGLTGFRDSPGAKRRGRKNMGEAEKREVSERMRKYWASKREGKSRAANKPNGKLLAPDSGAASQMISPDEGSLTSNADHVYRLAANAA